MTASEGGLGVVVTRSRKPRDKPRYDRAMVAILADDHVEEAIATIAAIMKSGARDGDRLQAAKTLIELALERDPTAGPLGADQVRIYVLTESAAPGVITAAVDEARRRRALPVGDKR